MNALQSLFSGDSKLAERRVGDGSPADDAAARQRAIRVAVERLAQGAASLSTFSISPPADGEVRVRKIVHRGTSRPVLKTFSVKLQRSIHSESPLERELALCLDASPSVDAYGEQPVRLNYALDGVQRSHIPDVAILADGKLWFFEVKFAKDVDGEVEERTVLMQENLARLGVGYALVTESHIRCGNRVQNAIRILRRSRHLVSRELESIVLHRVRSASYWTFGDFGWSSSEGEQTSALCSLVTKGLVRYDSCEIASASTKVWCAGSPAPMEASA